MKVMDRPEQAFRAAKESGVEESVYTADPAALVRSLEANERFRRDTTLGGILHRGKISFREVAPVDSLHVTIKGNRVSAHVDRICPLSFRPSGWARQYSFARVMAHNVVGLLGDLGRRVRRIGGVHRCQLECEVVWVDEEAVDDLVSEIAQEGAAAEAAPSDHRGHDHPGPGAGAGGVGAAGAAGAVEVPFGPVDEAVHLLDSAAAPWSVQLEVGVAGRLDPERLERAVAEALRRHPMARARMAPAPRTRRQAHWQIPDEPDVPALRVVDCPDDEALARARSELQSLPVPLVESPPLRLRLARRPAGDVLMLNVHHAACDGLGAVRLLGSVARAYTGEADPGDPVPLEEARTVPATLASAGRSVRARRWLVLAHKVADAVVPPARIAPHGASDEAGYGFHHVALSAPETARLLGRRPGGTVNDVLVAALHLAIAGWNADRRAGGRRIAVLVPANLRPAAWRHEVVGNFSLPARVLTSRRHRRSGAAAVAAVTAQTRRKKAVGMGTALVEVLAGAPLLPLWAKEALVALVPLTGNRFVDTAMLSNLGPLPSVPSFGPEAGETTEVWFSPPARMPMGLAVGAVTVSGRLHLAFRYRRRQFGTDAAAAFASRYLAELRGLVDRPGAGPA